MSWLDARGADWKAAVQVVAIDPCAAHRSAVEKVLPHAWIVADRFHLVRLANQMGTEVRQPAIRKRHGRRGRTTDPAWANRRLLLRAGDRLSAGRLGRRKAVFAADDPTGEIGAAGDVQERLRMLLAADDRHTTADMPESTRLAVTVDAWWPEILGFLETRITNAGTEGTNRMVKDTARIAFGFRNLDHQRRRVRFHCTGNHAGRPAPRRPSPTNLKSP